METLPFTIATKRIKYLGRGWDGEGGREGDAEGRRYGNVCISVADSLCYKAETNTQL